MTPTAHRPTERQLRYLRSLAARTATTFATPSTRAEASREIERLRSLGKASPREAPHDDPDNAQVYGTAVNDDEVTGFGASARWRRSAPRPSPAGPRRESRPPGVSQLARYPTAAGERVLQAEPHGGSLRIVDRPVGPGRSYVVEERLEHGGCSALVADYLMQARELDAVPMAGVAIAQLLSSNADV